MGTMAFSKQWKRVLGNTLTVFRGEEGGVEIKDIAPGFDLPKFSLESEITLKFILP